jgi:hypothetical protein
MQDQTTLNEVIQKYQTTLTEVIQKYQTTLPEVIHKYQTTLLEVIQRYETTLTLTEVIRLHLHALKRFRNNSSHRIKGVMHRALHK